MVQIRIREGFAGQKQWVLPGAIRDGWSGYSPLQALVLTDIGFYPGARYHYREREQGAEEHVLIFCVAGEGWYEIDGQRLPLQQNEALIIPRGTPHTYGASETNPWTIHWVHFAGTEADFFVSHLSPGELRLPMDARCSAQVNQLFNQCYESFVEGFVLHRLVYCVQILHHLLGCLFFNNASFSPAQRTSRFHSVEPTLTYLRQRIGENVTLEEMAEHAGLSVSHFSFLFKRQTGYSPMDYFIHAKMLHACSLLSLTDKTVHEIAYELGYQDPYYFSRIFKKVMGVAPRNFRKYPPNQREIERIKPS